MTHAKLSPSARHRWGKCPGSVRLEAAVTKGDGNNAAADDGTHTHTLLAAWLGDPDPSVKVDSFLGRSFKDHVGSFTVNQPRIDRVNVARTYIIQRLRDYGEFASIKSEVGLQLTELVNRDDLSGTSDVVIYSPLGIEVIDYKDGMVPVSAENNPQLQQYAVGVVSEMVKTGQNVLPDLPVRLTIIQPKLATRGLPTISFQDVTVNDVLRYADDIAKEAALTDLPDPPLVSGESQCKYCSAKGSCSAFASQGLASVNVDLLKGSLVDDAVGQDPNKMSNEQLLKVIEAAPLVRQLIEAAEAEALDRMLRGEVIQGLKVVKGRGARSWGYSDEEMEVRFKKMGIPKDQMYVRKLLSPAQVEKLTWDKRDGTKGNISEKMKEVLNKEYVVTTEGKPSVALAGDNRSELTYGAAKLFAPVNDVPKWLTAQ